MFYQRLAILALIILSCGCVEESSNNKNEDKKIGTIRSSDKNYIDLESDFNVSRMDFHSNDSFESYLKVYEGDLPYDHFDFENTPALWTLIFRVDSNPKGIYQAEDIEIKLLRNHTASSEMQSEDGAKFEYNDVAEITYLGVSGWVFFEYAEFEEFQGVGEYEVQFQQMSNMNNGSTIGQIVTVSGNFDLSSYF
jgi:hypothetical protein